MPHEQSSAGVLGDGQFAAMTITQTSAATVRTDVSPLYFCRKPKHNLLKKTFKCLIIGDWSG